MIDLTPQASRLLAGPHFAIVATRNRDDSLQQSVVWAGERDGTVVFSTVEGRAKHRNLLRDPRISVLIIDREDGLRYSEIRGTASLESENAPALIAELSLVYDGKPWVETEARPRITVVITPERITEH